MPLGVYTGAMNYFYCEDAGTLLPLARAIIDSCESGKAFRIQANTHSIIWKMGGGMWTPRLLSDFDINLDGGM